MVNYLVKGKTLTDIADATRRITDSTEGLVLERIPQKMDETSEEINEQSNLISQIITTLEGKATPSGGGEDVTQETNAYTNKIASLETAVTALEEELAGKASGGSGGGSAQTCSVTISASAGRVFTVYGANSTGVFTESSPYTDESNQESIWNGSVIKNSILVTLGILSSPQISGNVEVLLDIGMPIIVYAITGDCGISW